MKNKAKWLGFSLSILVAISFLPAHARAEKDEAITLNEAPLPKMPEDEQLVTSSSVTTHSSSAESATMDTHSYGHDTDISTVQNTYGVMTEERQGLALYAAPFVGMNSVFGNDSADFSPKYAAGGTLGLVLSSNMMIIGSFTYSDQSVSHPTIDSASTVALDRSNLMDFKQSTLEGGLRFYILGRESRVRPFISGGAGWTHGSLQYSSYNLQTLSAILPTYGNELTMNQLDAIGEVGAEVAITRQIVLSASFKMDGVLASSTSADGQNSSNYDPSKVSVGNSLSRSGSYQIAAGLGIYF